MKTNYKIQLKIKDAGYDIDFAARRERTVDENRENKYLISLSSSYGSSYSTYTTASYGHMKIEKLDNIKSDYKEKRTDEQIYGLYGCNTSVDIPTNLVELRKFVALNEGKAK